MQEMPEPVSLPAGTPPLPAPSSIEELSLIQLRYDDSGQALPEDLRRYADLWQHIQNYPWFWEVNIIEQGPVAMQQLFVSIFASTQSAVFDILGGQGVVAFDEIQKGWTARAHIALWGRGSYGRRDLFQRAALLACQAYDLIAINGFVPRAHHLALKNAEKSGMRFRGWIKNALVYNGVAQDAGWFEITREELEKLLLKGSDNGKWKENPSTSSPAWNRIPPAAVGPAGRSDPGSAEPGIRGTGQGGQRTYPAWLRSTGP